MMVFYYLVRKLFLIKKVILIGNPTKGENPSMRTSLLYVLPVLIIVLFLSNHVCYGSDNPVINNPGFEDGVLYWNLWGAEPPMINKQSHSGKNSLKAHDVTGGYSSGAWQSFKVEPGKSYLFGGWIKTESLDGEAWIELQWFDESNTIQIDETITSRGSLIMNGTKDWTKVKVEAIAPSNAKIARIAFKLEGTNGFAYFDDAEVVIEQKSLY